MRVIDDCQHDILQEGQEIYHVVMSVPWKSRKVTAVSRTGKTVQWQEAYHRLFEIEFERTGGWTRSPILCKNLTYKGDFLKNDVFVEIQFGNAATIYRDYYKFHYGRLVKKFLSLAVLIVPTVPVRFFPERNPNSIINMASYEYALEHFSALTIPVPTLLVGLLPSN